MLTGLRLEEGGGEEGRREEKGRKCDPLSAAICNKITVRQYATMRNIAISSGDHTILNAWQLLPRQNIIILEFDLV